jgi:hypothetical protein
MPDKKYPTQARLKELLRYDPITGSFTWIVERRRRVKAGTPAGSKHNAGYLTIRIDYVACLYHRLAFLYVHGFLPEQIDHINGDRTDNRISNLRAATGRLNSRNNSLRSDNKSGVCGVSWDSTRSKWVARIRTDSGYKYLGRFDDLEEAKRTYSEAKERYGYHPNHGLEVNNKSCVSCPDRQTPGQEEPGGQG